MNTSFVRLAIAAVLAASPAILSAQAPVKDGASGGSPSNVATPERAKNRATVFSRLDANKDGSLSREEFMRPTNRANAKGTRPNAAQRAKRQNKATTPPARVAPPSAVNPAVTPPSSSAVRAIEDAEMRDSKSSTRTNANRREAADGSAGGTGTTGSTGGTGSSASSGSASGSATSGTGSRPQ